MAFAFEVKETDLLGRIGTLRAGGKTLETPYMFPVIHPVSQGVTPDELKSMGFGGVMTNSYIIRTRRKSEALQQGLHRLVGFDGVVMTDSGGYQVLEYGDLGVTYEDMASFQSEIGSDIAVTLDRPTGFPQKRDVARETVEYSYRNAAATLEKFGDRPTVWVGPIQGGLYEDLVRRSAKSLVRAGFSYLALGSPVQVMQNYMFSDLVRMIVNAREAVPYSIPLHLFGAGHPLTMPMAVALGCDTFDSASYVLFARTGRYMTRGAILTLEKMSYLPCSCRVCTRTTVRELMELEHGDRTNALSVHNLNVLHEELEGCKEAIAEGRLWDLVEERSMAHPRLREAFAEFVRHSPKMAAGVVAQKDRGVMVRGSDDLERPELAIASERLRRSMRRSAKTAILLKTGEAAKEFKSRKTADVYRLNPVLGPYPTELEFVYPFAQTVTSDAPDEPARRRGVAKLRRMGYESVLSSGKRGKKLRSRRTRRASSPSPR